jgi:1,4-dihydroxy-2-naphthoate octaprenyltransferase|tara:strand:- start:3730 stop:4680 length:951 start_codon:yes stop_codon:yes gene_type:complete
LKKKINSILLAFRLKTLPAVLGPLFISISIIIHKNFDLIKIVLIILIGIFLQILVNLINDLEDSKKGIDNENRVGPIRATQSGLLKKLEIKLVIAFILLICLILGFIAFIMSGIISIIMGLILMILAYTYTGGPKPYGYIGLGEIAVMLVFGPFTVLGSLYLFSIYPTFEIILISLIPGLSASLIILVNNIRDCDNDKKSGKNTIAVKLGEIKSRYLFLGIVITIVMILIYLIFLLQNFLILIPTFISCYIFPLKDIGFKKNNFIYWSVDLEKSNKLSQLNSTLLKTVKSHFAICSLLSTSIIIWPYLTDIFENLN